MAAPSFTYVNETVESGTEWSYTTIQVPDTGVITRVRAIAEGISDLDIVLSRSSESRSTVHTLLAYANIDLTVNDFSSEESEYYQITPAFFEDIEDPIGLTKTGKPIYLVSWPNPADFHHAYRTYTASEHNDCIKAIDNKIKEKRQLAAEQHAAGLYSLNKATRLVINEYESTRQLHKAALRLPVTTAEANLYLWYKTNEACDLWFEIQIEVDANNDYWYSKSKLVSEYRTYPVIASGSSTTITSTGILDSINLTSSIDGETDTFTAEVDISENSKILLTLNGQVLAEGEGYDYTLSISEGLVTITLGITPELADVLVFYYIKTE